MNAIPIPSQTARTAKLPIAPQLAGDGLCTPRWFPRGGARCPTIGSAAVSTELIGKCSWYFSHPTTRIGYNSRSSGGQMLQPVLFYKLPNAVAPGAGRRTRREVQGPLSHAFASNAQFGLYCSREIFHSRERCGTKPCNAAALPARAPTADLAGLDARSRAGVGGPQWEVGLRGAATSRRVCT